MNELDRRISREVIEVAKPLAMVMLASGQCKTGKKRRDAISEAIDLAIILIDEAEQMVVYTRGNVPTGLYKNTETK